MLSLAVPALFVAIPLARMLGAGATTMEEANVLVVAAGILDGRFPHADVEYLYAPGTAWAVAGAFWTLGTSVAVERLVGLAYRLAFLWGIHRLARRWGSGTAACAAIASWAVIAPFGLEAYPWIAGLGLLVAGAALVLDGDDGRRASIGAALCGLAVFHQLVLGPAALVVVLPALLSADVRRRARLVTGLVAGLSPFLLHLVLVGPRSMLDGMVIDPIFRLRAGRSLPLPPDPSDSGDFFARLDDLLRGPDRLPGLDRPAQIAALFWLLVLATVALVVVARRWRGPGRTRFATMAAIAVALVPMALQRPSPNHLKFVGTFTVAVAVVAIAVPLSRRARSLAAPIALALVLGGLAVVAPHHIGRFTFEAFTDRPFDSSSTTVVHDGRTLPIGRGAAAAAVADEIHSVVSVVDYLTRPGDRLFVGPVDLTRTNYGDTFFYFLLPDLVPASRHLEMNPGLANRFGGNLPVELASADVLVLTDRFDGWSEPNASVRAGDPVASAVVAGRFCDVAGTATWRVLTPCR
ncbi:MAG TPA: hypothetical protein DCY78_05705 [Acidimicrobiaceae bacterium]|nr:hypothetical protein [Acidimicrobiaceae bacterium]